MLSSTSCAFPEPLVIRLTRDARARPTAQSPPPACRRNAVRDATLANIAATHRAGKNLTVDHVIPRSRGGGHNWENLTTAWTLQPQKGQPAI